MKLSVPYHSQFLEIDDIFWHIRACGAASLSMVVEYLGVPKQDMLAVCKEALTRGGYDMRDGWNHVYLLIKARELGFQAERKEGLGDINTILQSLDAKNPVIVSVEKRVLEQTRFHLLVVVGYEADTIIYHEPESTDVVRGAYRTCSREVFMNYWRGKAIFISK